MDTVPNLVPCPVCKKQVAEDAPLCPSCGTPVRKRLQQLRTEGEALQAQAEAEQQKRDERAIMMKTILYGAGGILLIYILHSIGAIK